MGTSGQRRLGCLVLLAVLGLAGCGEQASDGGETVPSNDPGPIHVHGLGINPTDRALFVATHTGLFRAAVGERRAHRVADRYQDTMGFTVVGPDRFLGSGHPDLREELPPFLGLIESRDAGKTWRTVSLQGRVDFHLLEASGRRIYGYGSDFDSRQPRFLTSGDAGRRWSRLRAPEPLVSLAISPGDSGTLIASGERRVFRSRDGGGSWVPVDAPGAGLLAWTRGGMFLVGLDGRFWRAAPQTRSWQAGGLVGGAPAAFDTGPDDELLIALHDGTVKQSADAGRSWSVRSEPD